MLPLADRFPRAGPESRAVEEEGELDLPVLEVVTLGLRGKDE